MVRQRLDVRCQMLDRVNQHPVPAIQHLPSNIYFLTGSERPFRHDVRAIPDASAPFAGAQQRAVLSVPV